MSEFLFARLLCVNAFKCHLGEAFDQQCEGCIARSLLCCMLMNFASVCIELPTRFSLCIATGPQHFPGTWKLSTSHPCCDVNHMTLGNQLPQPHTCRTNKTGGVPGGRRARRQPALLYEHSKMS